MNERWRIRLRQARRDLGVSQTQLAERSRVSVDAIRAWESGRRRPTRSRLTRVLDALKIAQIDRNEILSGAGFASDGLDLVPPRERRMLSLDETRAERVVDAGRDQHWSLNESCTQPLAHVHALDLGIHASSHCGCCFRNGMSPPAARIGLLS